MFSRIDIAAVVLSLVDRPLHYDYDLNYITEVVRGTSGQTPWNTIGRDVKQKSAWFVSMGRGYYDLRNQEKPRKEFVISIIGENNYNKICQRLREAGFLNEQNELKWEPHRHYPQENNVSAGSVRRQTVLSSTPISDSPELIVVSNNQYGKNEFLREVFIGSGKI